jgi:hypothetical protein
MLDPTSVGLLAISAFSLPSSAQTTYIDRSRDLTKWLAAELDKRLWSWESAKARPLACVGRTPYSGPGEFSMWEAEAFLGRLVDFGGLMATRSYPLPRSAA